tara:strand:- start:1669 stop:3846 length:2178 start_codon:yes stop_codon:yes gene_type:complete
MTKAIYLRGAAVAVVAAMTVSTPVYAQDEEGARDSNVIIVTAMKRETQLETTPMAISVLGGDALTASGIDEIKGLSATVPGLTLNESPSGFSGVSIRGVGTSAGSQVYEQSVGLFVDGVYHPRGHQYRDALFDVERVEVIKGSQGVLFGKNTSIGAVSVISQGPGSESGGHIQAEYDVNFDGHSIDAGIDAVVSDTFKLRISGLYEDFGAYVNNVTLNRDEPSGDRLALRGIFEWEPTDTISIRAKAQLGFYETTGDAFEYITDLDPAVLQSLGVADGGQSDFVKYSSNENIGNSGDDYESQDYSLEANIELGGDFTLTSVSGYTKYKYLSIFDADAVPALIFISDFDDRYSQFTQELRLTSPSGEALEYIVGAFYLNSEIDYTLNTVLNNFGPALTGSYNQNFDQDQNTYAVFGQATWHIADDIQLNLGGRYTIDKKTGQYQRVFLDDFGSPGLLGIIGATTPVLTQSVTDKTLDFSATLSYNPTPSSTLYISGGQGNKGSGYFNTSGLGTVAPAPFIVPPEKATTIEAGFKGRFVDGRMYFAIAAYHLDIKNYQDSYFDALQAAFVSRAIDAKSTGVEVEATFDVTDGVNLYGNFAWSPEAKLADGFRQQRAPKFTSNLGVRFNTELSDDFSLTGFGQWQHSGSFLHQPEFFAADLSSLPFDLFSARLEVKHAPSQLSFYVRGDNLSDEKYRTFMFGGVIPGIGNVGAFNKPRTFTFGVRKDF